MEENIEVKEILNQFDDFDASDEAEVIRILLLEDN